MAESSRMNRRLPRAATFAFEGRRNSISDSLSEARNSIRSSTDELLLPRVAKDQDEVSESHWHSAPLGLALLPAIAGIFFHEGSAFVTDVTLLVLAAIFLNWSVRLPWDWYRSAQAIRREGGFQAPVDQTPFQDPELEDDETTESSHQHQPSPQSSTAAKAAAEASTELQLHELAALSACFIFPVIGTWLLHAIRSSLSRPSEGLVSNYNLTIFLLASEVRPVAHLLRLIQKRTLHLQRIVASTPEPFTNPTTIKDVTKRLEELEAHIAETALSNPSFQEKGTEKGKEKEDRPLSPKEQPDSTPSGPSLVTQTVTETRKSIQPDIEALNRAVRRYEKRSVLFSLQTDQRFANLEAQTADALTLAAAARRSATSRRRNYALVLLDWACACVVVPAQIAWSVVSLPGWVLAGCMDAVKRRLPWKDAQSRSRPKAGSKGRTVAGSQGGYRQSGGSMQRRSVKNGEGMG
ncbi:uncharacterized protein N7515_000587 [Penicillium bovifimosum]|uniref:Uncharacterized protein n=1 Tax=Penicillium bovifimosum TaxID=126998 RepID=A0A9W9HG17_9EURO|nr:uncharacterized protein N7515_000587 [Penicillium bovifimosum]KAJ5146023.1 hypothetical protein N7515_000587 [Penicillium bovifimosum]